LVRTEPSSVKADTSQVAQEATACRLSQILTKKNHKRSTTKRIQVLSNNHGKGCLEFQLC
jgi:hypothetical protein